MTQWEWSCSMESGQCPGEDGRTVPAHCSVPSLPFSWSSRDVREPSQWNEGCTPPHWPNHCTRTPVGRLPLGGWHCLHRLPCAGPKERASVAVIFTDLWKVHLQSLFHWTCGISIYVKYCKTLAIYFSSVWILSLCVLLLRRNINIIIRLFNMAEYTHS